MISLKAVSYTHLDVYKRQHHGISPNINPKYSQTGWMIPGDAMSEDDARSYGLGVVEKDGEAIGYLTNGMPARPYLLSLIHIWRCRYD